MDRLSDSSIGIKIADGTFYPVLEEDFRGRKRVVLTTVRDNQTAVQIDLYRGQGRALEGAEYVGSLIIENIQPAPKGEPEIEVVLGLDEQGNLNATANDKLTGEKQSLSVSMQSLGPDRTYDIPEFSFEKTPGEPLAGEPPAAPEREEPIAGESYPVDSRDRRLEHLERRRRSPLLLALIIVLALLLIAGVGYLILGGFKGPQTSPPDSGAVMLPEETRPAEQPGAAESAAADTAGEAVGTAEDARGADDRSPAEPTMSAAAPAAVLVSQPPPSAEAEDRGLPPASEPQQAPSAGVWYWIKWGDTLWDLAGTYYRNPWLYPKIAKANRIRNPDLIFAETKIFIPRI